MKKKKYENLKDYEEDMQLMNENPNDLELLDAIISRVNNSSDQVKAAIKERLVEMTFANNPMLILEKVAQSNPDKKVIIKSKSDPWFNT